MLQCRRYDAILRHAMLHIMAGVSQRRSSMMSRPRRHATLLRRHTTPLRHIGARRCYAPYVDYHYRHAYCLRCRHAIMIRFSPVDFHFPPCRYAAAHAAFADAAMLLRYAPCRH